MVSRVIHVEPLAGFWPFRQDQPFGRLRVVRPRMVSGVIHVEPLAGFRLSAGSALRQAQGDGEGFLIVIVELLTIRFNN